MISELSMHSCSYYCDRPDCIKAQRDDFRDNYVAAKAANATLNNTRSPMELTDSEWYSLLTTLNALNMRECLTWKTEADEIKAVANAARQWLAERGGR